MAFVIASLANVFITIGADARARRRPRQGCDRRDRRQLHRHARRVPRPARLPPRATRAQFDRDLLRQMNNSGSRSSRPRSSSGSRTSATASSSSSSPTSPRSASTRSASVSPARWSCCSRRSERRGPRSRTRSETIARRGARTPSSSRTSRGDLWVALLLTLLSPWIVDALPTRVRQGIDGRRPARLRDCLVRGVHRLRDRRRAHPPDAVQLGRDRSRRRPRTSHSTSC